MQKLLCVWRLTASFLVFLVVFMGCKQNEIRPSEILAEAPMAAILTDVHIIEGAKTGRKMIGDTLKVETYYKKVFTKHSTTLEQFNLSFEYYTKHPEEMNGIYERVVENLNKMEIRVPAWEYRDKNTEEATPIDSTTEYNIKESAKKLSKKLPFKKADSTTTN